jgi:hypothetical protein
MDRINLPLDQRRNQELKNKLEQEYQEHIANEGDGAANDHPDGCFFCGSSLHHSQDCRERE